MFKNRDIMFMILEKFYKKSEDIVKGDQHIELKVI